LSAARGQAFVGRRAELDLFRTALSEELPPFAVLHVHGPGGVGKSALLARLCDEARRADRRTVLLDGRGVTPSPTGLTAAISASRRV
jgi:ABC-type hemin transport system ATPase subunit